MKRTNILFWIPAFIGIISFIALFLIALLSFCSSGRYKEYIEKERILDAQNAIHRAYKTKQKCDITRAQTYINALNDSDMKKFSKKLSSLSNDIEKLNNIQKNINQLKQNITKKNLENTQKSINCLNASYVQNDKKKFQKLLEEYYKKYEAQFKDKKIIALTFDDGPNPDTTPQLLDILEEKKISVTFFALGENAQKHPEIISQEAQKGHEVASHTWSHSDLKTLSKQEQKKEIMSANQFINKITGQNVTLFRPPYGSYDDNILSVTPLTAVNWSVDTNDWRYTSSDPVVQNAVTYAYDGSILLMHDIHPWSVEAVSKIIDKLSQEGYIFVTVSTLLKLQNNGNIQPHTAYFD